MKLHQRIGKAIQELDFAWLLARSEAAARTSGGTKEGPKPDGPPFTQQDVFGVGKPMDPIYRNVVPRTFDFAYNANTNIAPRSTETNSFGLLTSLATVCTPAQYCIRFKTDEMTGSKFAWVAENPEEAEVPEIKEAIREASEFWEWPNRIDGIDWDTFLSQWIYEVLVTDAPSFYVQRSNGGDVHSFVQVDGTTIKPVIDNFGHVVLYQQVIKGMVRGDYKVDELLYQPMNPQIASVYGRSPTEMVLTELVTYVRRSLFNLSWYDTGTTPDVWVELPEGSTPEMAAGWTEVLNTINSGDSAQRFHVKPLPPGAKVSNVRGPVWGKEQDEWLFKVVCAMFQVNPIYITPQMNRATAEVAEGIHVDAGLRPLQRYIERRVARMERLRMGDRRIKPIFVEDKLDVSVNTANGYKVLIDAGLVRREEIRVDKLGLKADEEIAALPLGPIQPPPPPSPFGSFGMPTPASPEPEPTKPEPEPEPPAPPPVDPKAAKAELSTWRKFTAKHGVEKSAAFKAEAIPAGLASYIRANLSDPDVWTKAAGRVSERHSRAGEAGFRQGESRIETAARKYLEAKKAEILTRAMADFAERRRNEGAGA